MNKTALSLLIWTSAIAGCSSTSKLMSWNGREPKPLSSVTQSADKISKDKTAPTSTTVLRLVEAGQSEIGLYREDYQEHHLQLAKRHFDSALRESPNNIHAHNGLAIVSDIQRDWAKAEYHYKRALAHDPADTLILGNMGYSYFLQDRLGESEMYLKMSVESDPSNTKSLQNLVEVYNRQNKTELANQTLAKLSAEEISQRQSELQLASSEKPAEQGSLMDRLLRKKSLGDKFTEDFEKLKAERDLAQLKQNPGGAPQISSTARQRLMNDEHVRNQFQMIDREVYANANSNNPILLNSANGQAIRIDPAQAQQIVNHAANSPMTADQPVSMVADATASQPQGTETPSTPADVAATEEVVVAATPATPVSEATPEPAPTTVAATPAPAENPAPAAVPATNEPVQQELIADATPQAEAPAEAKDVVPVAGQASPIASAVTQAHAMVPEVEATTTDAAGGTPNENSGRKPWRGQAGNSITQYQRSSPSGNYQLIQAQMMNQQAHSGMGPQPVHPQMQSGVPANNAYGSPYFVKDPNENSSLNAYHEATRRAARIGMGLGAAGGKQAYNSQNPQQQPPSQVPNQPSQPGTPQNGGLQNGPMQNGGVQNGLMQTGGSISPQHPSAQFAYENAGVPQPMRQMPDDAFRKNLGQTYQPYGQNITTPATTHGAQAPSNVIPMQSRQQYDNTMRFDTQSMQNTNIPQSGWTAMQDYEAARWAAGQQQNRQIQQVWAPGPVNSAVSQNAGSQYSQPNSAGMMYTPNAPTGVNQWSNAMSQPQAWPYRPSDMNSQNPGDSPVGNGKAPGTNAGASPNYYDQFSPSTRNYGNNIVIPPSYGTNIDQMGMPEIRPR